MIEDIEITVLHCFENMVSYSVYRLSCFDHVFADSQASLERFTLIERIVRCLITCRSSGLALVKRRLDESRTEDADVDVNPADRELGGMGIYIVKNIMNQVTYQRLKGKNLLTMKKSI